MLTSVSRRALFRYSPRTSFSSSSVFPTTHWQSSFGVAGSRAVLHLGIRPDPAKLRLNRSNAVILTMEWR